MCEGADLIGEGAELIWEGAELTRILLLSCSMIL